MEIERILVTGNIVQEVKKQINHEAWPQSFRFLEEKEVTKEDLQWADAYVAFKPTANFDFYDIKWVHSLGAGVDGYLFRGKWKEDVLLTRTICSFGQRISQYCLSYVLQDLQKHRVFQEQQHNKQWKQVTPQLLEEQKVLIYGTGEIGQETAELFHSFGLDVFGVSRSGDKKEGFKRVFAIGEEKEILPEIDVVINTLPLTEQTFELFGREILSRLNQALFINVGRGASVVEVDLLDSLEHKHLRLAVLDVFAEEPLPNDSPFWHHPAIMVTPHVSAVTTAEEAADCFLDTWEKLKKQQPLPNKVDIGKGY